MDIPSKKWTYTLCAPVPTKSRKGHKRARPLYGERGNGRMQPNYSISMLIGMFFLKHLKTIKPKISPSADQSNRRIIRLPLGTTIILHFCKYLKRYSTFL